MGPYGPFKEVWGYIYIYMYMYIWVFREVLEGCYTGYIGVQREI